MKMPKKLKRKTFTLIVLFILPLFVFCQPEGGKPHLGIKFGGTYNYFGRGDLFNTLYPDVTNMNCIHEENKRFGSTIGAFYYYRGLRDYFAFQGELTYTFKYKGNPVKDYDFLYASVDKNIIGDLFYQFNYEYINITPVVKLYPINEDLTNARETHGFNIMLGGSMGIISSADRLNMGSTIHNYTYVLNQRNDYRKALRGISNLSLIGGIGWDGIGRTGWMLEARYSHGLKDVIEVTQPSKGVDDRPVMYYFFEFSIGYTFPSNGN